MIAEQRVKARGQSIAFVKASTGNECAGVSFLLEEGPDKGKIIDWTGWLSDKAIERTGQALAACGYDGSDPTTIGRNLVELVIQHEQPKRQDGSLVTKEDGSPFLVERVAFVNAVGGIARMQAMAPSEEAAAKQKLKAVMMAARAKAPPAPNSTKPEDEPRF